MGRSRGARSLALCTLLLSGCTDPAPSSVDPSSTGTQTSTDAVGSTTAAVADATSDSGPADSTGADLPAEPDDCQAPQVIPPPPSFCAGATGVLMADVEITPGGDDPSILEGVRRVEGEVVIHGTTLTNLDFMACLAEVTGEVTIYDNDALTNVDGLWSLSEIGTSFVFSHNDAIVDFDGLPNVTELRDNLLINDNAALEGISGLHRLEALHGTTDRETGTFYGGNVTIQHNPVLQHIDGLGGLRICRGVIAITNNPVLCRSSVACALSGIVEPPQPPPSWPVDPYADC